MKTLFLATMTSLGMAGCARHVIGNSEWFNSASGGKVTLKKRASFDLSCKSLAFTPLGGAGDGYDVVGITGCGKKATYVRAEGQWLLQTDSVEAPPS